MNLIHSSLRHLLVAVAGILLPLTAALVVAPPAHAVNYEGYLGLKGAGSTYTSLSPVVVARAGASGQTLSFGVYVANAGQTETQYVLKLSRTGLAADVGLYEGSTLRRLANTSEGYVTAPLEPQEHVTFTLKIKAYDANVSWRNAAVNVVLAARDGTVLKSGVARFEMKAPLRGSSAADVTAREGSQAYVGSRWDVQYTQAPWIAHGGTARYTVKQAVNAGAPHRIRTYIPLPAPDCQSFTVKEGTVDVTAAVKAGTYYTKVLSPGQSVLLTVTYTKTGFQSCGPQYLTVYGGAEGEPFTTTLVLIAP